MAGSSPDLSGSLVPAMIDDVDVCVDAANNDDDDDDHGDRDVHYDGDATDRPLTLHKILRGTGRLVEKAISQYFPEVSHVITKYELEPGDHVYAYRAAGIYSHHGIYAGNSEVIHLNGEPGTSLLDMDTSICKDTLTAFLNGASLRRYKYGVEPDQHFMKRKGTCCVLPSDPPDEVLARALHSLENQGLPRYNVLNFNCEHFSLYCKLGPRIMELGGDWLGQLLEVLVLPLYPIKAAAVAMGLVAAGKGRVEAIRQAQRPLEERMVDVGADNTSHSLNTCDPHPNNNSDPQPITNCNPNPTTTCDPNPTTTYNPQPITRDPQPITCDPHPTTTHDPQPITTSDSHPTTTSDPQQPATKRSSLDLLIDSNMSAVTNKKEKRLKKRSKN